MVVHPRKWAQEVTENTTLIPACVHTVTERICVKVILAVYCVVMTIMKGEAADLTQNIDFRHQNMFG